MLTQREIDELHVSAQNYQEQIRAEFQRGLMGKRVDRNAQKASQPIQADAPNPQVPMAGYGENKLP